MSFTCSYFEIRETVLSRILSHSWSLSFRFLLLPMFVCFAFFCYSSWSILCVCMCVGGWDWRDLKKMTPPYCCLPLLSAFSEVHKGYGIKMDRLICKSGFSFPLENGKIRLWLVIALHATEPEWRDTALSLASLHLPDFAPVTLVLFC